MLTDKQQSLSPFQQWKLEDDIKFYTTFPQARPATNQYTFQPPQCDDFFGSSGFGINLGRSYAPDEMTTELSQDRYSLTSSQPAPAPGCGEQTEPSLLPALHYNYRTLQDPSRTSSSSQSYTVQPGPPISHDSPVSRRSHNSVSFAPPDISVPASQSYHSPLPLVDVQSQIIVPSHQPPCSPQHHPLQPEPPIMDYLPSPSSPAPPSHLHMTRQASFDSDSAHEVPSNQWRLPDHIDTPWQYEPLPESSVIRTNDPPFSSRPLQAPPRAFYRTVRSQSYPHFHPGRHNIQPPGWPMVRTPSPRLQLSPLPSKRQLEKKPPLACLFCRGRKIACGPPEPGSEDPTCNQCQRRSIKCEYPSESRRGMRRKKSVVGDNTAGPKVKAGKRSRSNG